MGSHNCYIAELEPETGRALAYCPGISGEWGYLDLVEMEATAGPWSIIERELDITPTSARALATPGPLRDEVTDARRRAVLWTELARPGDETVKDRPSVLQLCDALVDLSASTPE